MWVEAWSLKDEEEKKKALSNKELKKYNDKQKDIKKSKDKIDLEEKKENKKELSDIVELVEKWIISEETAKDIAEWNDIDDETIKEIFEKIEELEDIKDVDNILPKELRITTDEYFKAVNDDIFRVQTLTKLDSALTLIANKITPDSSMWLNLFSGFLTVLDKNLIKVQENTIDVKDSLEEINNKKFWKKEDNRSFWQKIIDFLKEFIK